MAEKRLELFHEYRESGFDGKYERTTTYTLSVGDGNRNAIATLEVEVESRTDPGPSERVSLTRYQIGVKELVELLQKSLKPSAS